MGWVLLLGLSLILLLGAPSGARGDHSFCFAFCLSFSSSLIPSSACVSQPDDSQKPAGHEALSCGHKSLTTSQAETKSISAPPTRLSAIPDTPIQPLIQGTSLQAYVPVLVFPLSPLPAPLLSTAPRCPPSAALLHQPLVCPLTLLFCDLPAVGLPLVYGCGDLAGASFPF